jgi:hypothetical protein
MSSAQSQYRLWWDDDSGIARCEWHPGSTCGVDEARAVINDLRALDRGRVPVLVDMLELTKFDRGGREYFSTDHGAVGGVALLVGSAVNKMMANFFIGTQRTDIPIRMFTDRDLALEWLAEHR